MGSLFPFFTKNTTIAYKNAYGFFNLCKENVENQSFGKHLINKLGGKDFLIHSFVINERNFFEFFKRS